MWFANWNNRYCLKAYKGSDRRTSLLLHSWTVCVLLWPETIKRLLSVDPLYVLTCFCLHNWLIPYIFSVASFIPQPYMSWKPPLENCERCVVFHNMLYVGSMVQWCTALSTECTMYEDSKLLLLHNGPSSFGTAHSSWSSRLQNWKKTHSTTSYMQSLTVFTQKSISAGA
jgi:hypothetical protein